MSVVAEKNLSKFENWLYETIEQSPSSSTRRSDFDDFLKTGLPNRRMEGWRWTDVESALNSETYDDCLADDPFKEIEALRIVVNGDSIASENLSSENIEIQAVDEPSPSAISGNSSLVSLTRALASTVGKSGVLEIKVNVEIEKPIHLVFAQTGERGCFSRVRVSIARNASVELIESYVGGSQFSSTLMEIDIDEGGSLKRTVFQSASPKQVQHVNASVKLREGSNFDQTALAFGGKIARLQTHLTYLGEHAEARINAAYVVGDGKHVDFTSDIHHSAQYCKTDQQTKGAVQDGGRGVFQGKFLVPKEVGQHTDANMQHHALLLGDRAEVFAKPELEIYADDVACAHGNTSGSMDLNQLFYLRQRGIPESLAKEILTRAFVSSVIDNASLAVQEVLSSAINECL